ncbi:MAG: GTPase [bacterium]|nr:50S ribosome-binding GTPase [bacterium]MBU1917712.1 50S ribosome-binding GTPase [bacterium]
MPANLTPEYLNAEKRFKEAREIDDKITCLEEMLSTLPKHKGTDKLYADLKKRYSKLKEQKDTQKKSGTRKEHWQVRKEGAGQIVLAGPPNTGKSSILTAFTKATPQVSDYPFSTRAPTPGMMMFEDIQIQLVELPSFNGDMMETYIPNAIMMSDTMLIVLDMSADSLLDDVEGIFAQILSRHIHLATQLPKSLTEEENLRLKRTLFLVNKMDHPDAQSNLELFKEWLHNYRNTEIKEGEENLQTFLHDIDIIPFSSIDDNFLKIFPRQMYDFLKVIRVYPKRPGKKLKKEDPLVLDVGTTVIEAARSLHKDISENLKFAKGWGEGIYEGQSLARDFVLKDGFVLEFHF